MTTTPANSYKDVKLEIMSRLRAGTWRLGEIIPREQTLAEEFGCARVTVNRALRELAIDGIVERKRKGGTRIICGEKRAARIEIPLVRLEIEQRSSAYRYSLLSREICTAPDHVRSRLNLKSRVKALHVRSLHLADERPYQLEDRWINLAAAPAARTELFNTTSPNEWLVREKPLSDAEHIFVAANANKEDALLLDIERHDAVFVIERRTWLDSETITWVRMLHPGWSYRMISQN